MMARGFDKSRDVKYFTHGFNKQDERPTGLLLQTQDFMRNFDKSVDHKDKLYYIFVENRRDNEFILSGSFNDANLTFTKLVGCLYKADVPLDSINGLEEANTFELIFTHTQIADITASIAGDVVASYN